MIDEIINNMFDLLLDKNTYSDFGIFNKATYWKIGTSIFNTFDRLSKNLLDVDVSYPMIVYENPERKTIQGNNSSYVFKINNKNVTPCKVRGFVSDSAIHQYRSMICAFGLGVDAKEYKNKKDFCVNNGTLKLVSNIKNEIKKENRINLIIKTIVKSFFSNVEDLRKISYSILIEILIHFNYDFNKLNANNQIFYWNKSIGPSNKKTKICASLVNDLEEIKQDILRQGTIATYKEVVECISSLYNLNHFIKEIWNEYQSLKNKDYRTNDMILNQIEKNNVQNEMKRLRSKFKENIFTDRKQRGLIENKNDSYSDLIDENGSQDKLKSRFNESEAAHIFQVKQIKQSIDETYELLSINSQKINLLKNSISDPNNGLMMSVEYHKTFDRGLWSFDANGEMLINKDNEDYLFNERGLRRIKINPKVFNEEMKEYLKKR